MVLAITNKDYNINELDSYAKEVIENEAIFLEKMNEIVFHYDADAKRSVQVMKHTHMFLFICIIMIIIFIIVKIFIPLLKYLDKAFWKLQESNQNLTMMF